MNIEKFKHQHVDILTCIADLRRLVREGIQQNCEEIAGTIISMSSTIKLHLAVEDRLLYPVLQSANNPALARMGQRFQDEMTGIALAYLDFSKRWNMASTVAQHAEEFRADANGVLKTLYERMRKEDTEFYPAIESA